MERRDNKLIGILVIGGLIWWLYRKKTTGITITPTPEVVKEVPPAELPPSMIPETEQQLQPPTIIKDKETGYKPGEEPIFYILTAKIY